MLNDYGYIDKAIANIREVAEKQEANIKAAATLMADAIAADKLINVYAGGGHTTLAMGEMFFRAGGLANINPMMETALSVFNQALKYLALERTVNFGGSDQQVILFSPKTFDEAGELVSYLQQDMTCVMTLETVPAETARRLLDFLSGIAFALGGKITPVSAKTYFITPQNVDILGTQPQQQQTEQQPESSGHYF